MAIVKVFHVKMRLGATHLTFSVEKQRNIFLGDFFLLHSEVEHTSKEIL